MASSVHPEPKPGDMIQITRTGYKHWAICVGDGYVVHLAPLSENPGAGFSSLFSVLSDTAVVKMELLTDVVRGRPFEVNNYLDHLYKPRSVNKIISSAKAMVGKIVKYSVTSRNCEHFVTDLRYHKPYSSQVQGFMMGEGGVLESKLWRF